MLAWASVMLVLHWNLCAAEHLCHACMRGVSGWIRVASSVDCSAGQGRRARQHPSQRVWQQWLLVLPGMQAAMGPLACRPKDIKQCAESQLVVASCRSDLHRQACAGREVAHTLDCWWQPTQVPPVPNWTFKSPSNGHYIADGRELMLL